MRYIRFTATFVLALAFASAALAQRSLPTSCVTIIEPKIDENVEDSVLVTGTITGSPRGSLWVFVRREGLAPFWPQGGGSATIRNGRWSVLAFIGQPRDRGAGFEILAAFVDKDTDAKLQAYFTQGAATGNYPGIPLPRLLDGCGEPARTTVTKSS